MALNGNLAKLDRHILRVERLGKPESMVSLTDNLAQEALDLVAEGFADEKSPYGDKWAPKVFSDGRKVLSGRTSNLKRAWRRVRSDGKGFRISSGVSYAKFHQSGTGLYGPRKRRIYPVNAKALSFIVQGSVSVAWARKLQGKMNRYGLIAGQQRKVLGKVNSQRITVMSVKGSPKRLMVPLKGKPLPPHYAEAFVEVCDVWFAKNFKS